MQDQRSNPGQTMMLHNYSPQANVPTKYQLPTPYGFQNIARTRHYRSGSHGKVKGQIKVTP